MISIEQKIKRNVELRNYTTFKIGGRADYFFKTKNKEELKEGIKWAQTKKMPFFVLGGGSNILVRDEGIRGLVIQVPETVIFLESPQKIKEKSQNKENFKEEVLLECGGGVKLSNLVDLTLKNGLSGLEWAAGIPRATIGGAVYMNAGAFGFQIDKIVKKVEVFDTERMNFKRLLARSCHFDRKQSIFQKKKNLIIISVLLMLEKKPKAEIQRKIKENLSYRKKRHPINFPSAGCIFKNPFLKEQQIKNLEIPEEFKKQGIIPAGWLIEKCGLAGKVFGGAEISKKHANFIINKRGAKANEVITLINVAQEKVKENFNIILEKEIEIIPPNPPNR